MHVQHFHVEIVLMSHLMPMDMEKAYTEKLVKMLITRVAVAVTKPEGGKRG